MTENRIVSVETALDDLRQGKIIIAVDDAQRENEGDFITAAQFITPEKVNFMLRYGRGIMCVALPPERCEALQLPMMVAKNTSLLGTPFTVSVDLLGGAQQTGVSAADRSGTIRALVDPATRPEQLGRPGHIFPLRACADGVLARDGHTEATVDLTRLAGLTPGGVLIEVMTEEGTMARLPQLCTLAEKHDLHIITIRDLIRYRTEHGL